MIDTHVHLWTVDSGSYPWQPTLPGVPIPTYGATIEMYREAMDEAGVEGAILVQPSQYGWDNSYLCASMEGGRFVGVCLVDPHSVDAARDLRYWCGERGCRGVRINTVAQVDDGRWLLSPGMAGLWREAELLHVVVCFQMLPRQSDAVAALARRYPKVRILVDSLGPEAFRDQASLRAIDLLAVEPNIMFKVVSAAQDSDTSYPFPDIWPLVRRAVERFGVARVTTGTDYPYILQSCTYQEATAWLGHLTFLTSGEVAVISSDNARLLWSI